MRGHKPLENEHESRPRAGHPSWSWASVDGPVYNHRINEEAIQNVKPLIILDPSVLYAPGQDRFGFPESAELDATGPLLKVFLDIVRTEKGAKDVPRLWLANDNPEESKELNNIGEVDLDVLIGPGGRGRELSGGSTASF